MIIVKNPEFTHRFSLLIKSIDGNSVSRTTVRHTIRRPLLVKNYLLRPKMEVSATRIPSARVSKIAVLE